MPSAYVFSFEDVQSYLAFCEQEDVSSIRPQACDCCGANSPLNRHGVYRRPVWCHEGRCLIPVFRFQCPLCLKTVSVLPSFIGRYERCTWDVQEDVLVAVDEASSYEQAAEQVAPPIGPLSSRTVWRWVVRWRGWVQDVEAHFWKWLIERTPTLDIPRGRDRPKTQLALFQRVWRQVASMSANVRLFHTLFRLGASLGLFTD